ncbi:MAG: acyl-CoA dehydrogenase family protein [Gammaproteobacteria bacterium]
MNLDYSAAHMAFQREVREFLAANWPPRGEEAALPAGEQRRRFRTRAIEAGYLYRNIPRRYGGSEQVPDPIRGHIIRQEFNAARAPREIEGNGVTRIVPTLLEHGNPWQRERFIGPAIRGEHIWCQGYSEPNAGSDLASLRTRAELVGDQWVINGQKIWTSRAHIAHYMFALVRTEKDVSKHAGISYLLIDMKQPGIEVRPLRQMTGGASFNEVYLTDARTPADWIVGERGQGWKVSRTTLRFERNQIGGPEQGVKLFDKIVKLARRTQRNGRPAIQDPEVRQWLVALEGFVRAHYWAGFHQFSRDAKGQSAGILELMNKFVQMHVIGLEAARIVQELIGEDALLLAQGAAHSGDEDFDPDQAQGAARAGNERWVNYLLGSLAQTIGGGTSNIQRNIIAERGLGMPRDDVR